MSNDEVDSPIKLHDAITSEMAHINERISDNSIMELAPAVRDALESIWVMAKKNQREKTKTLAEHCESLDELIDNL